MCGAALGELGAPGQTRLTLVSSSPLENRSLCLGFQATLRCSRGSGNPMIPRRAAGGTPSEPAPQPAFCSQVQTNVTSGFSRAAWGWGEGLTRASARTSEHREWEAPSPSLAAARRSLPSPKLRSRDCRSRSWPFLTPSPLSQSWSPPASSLLTHQPCPQPPDALRTVPLGPQSPKFFKTGVVVINHNLWSIAERKTWGPLFKIIMTFRVVTAEP